MLCALYENDRQEYYKVFVFWGIYVYKNYPVGLFTYFLIYSKDFDEI